MSDERLSISELTERPIPLDLPSVAGWKEIPIRECDEPLVSLGPFSEYNDIFTDAIYSGERKNSPYFTQILKGSLLTVFVRRSVADQLRKAQGLLPQGMYLLVLDGYRELEVQQSLYNVYFDTLKKLHSDLTDERLSVETQKYVSLPSQNPRRPSPHNTGGSVDMAIFRLPEEIDKKVREIKDKLKTEKDWREAYRLEMRMIYLINEHAQVLEFGTQFDYGGQEAGLDYFERLAKKRRLTPKEEEARRNRRLLFWTMEEIGLKPYQSEWWHFNSKRSQMGAKTAGLDYAEFGAINLSAENLKHEQMRKGHRLGSIRIFEGMALPLPGKIHPLEEHYQAAVEAVEEVGDLRKTSLPEAAVITPSKDQ